MYVLDRGHQRMQGQPPDRPGRLHLGRRRPLGNLYVADCFAGRLQKFEPIPGADPSKLVGQIQRTWD